MPALDLSLVIVTLVTGLFCLQLNQRLKRLHDLKSGLGGAVTALAQSVSQLRRESEAVSARMNAASDRVERLLVQVDACEPRIDILLETMDRQAREIWREDKARMSRARQDMNEIKQDAQALSQLLNEQLCLVAEKVEIEAKRADNVFHVAPSEQKENPFAKKASG